MRLKLKENGRHKWAPTHWLGFNILVIYIKYDKIRSCSQSSQEQKSPAGGCCCCCFLLFLSPHLCILSHAVFISSRSCLHHTPQPHPCWDISRSHKPRSLWQPYLPHHSAITLFYFPLSLPLYSSRPLCRLHQSSSPLALSASHPAVPSAPLLGLFAGFP